MSNIKLYELKKLQTHFPAMKITSSKDAAEFIRQFYGDDLEIFESFFVLMLNKANKTIGYAKISQGGISGTVVDIRIIMKFAVESLAVGIIVAHNHPSGNLQPSDADKQLTYKLKSSCLIMDVPLLDHIILSAEGYLSFSDEGYL